MMKEVFNRNNVGKFNTKYVFLPASDSVDRKRQLKTKKSKLWNILVLLLTFIFPQQLVRELKRRVFPAPEYERLLSRFKIRKKLNVRSSVKLSRKRLLTLRRYEGIEAGFGRSASFFFCQEHARARATLTTEMLRNGSRLDVLQ